MKVLISAYACEPKMGSEEDIGWNTVKAMSNFHEIWVITRVKNRVSIESELEENRLLNVHFLYYDLPFCHRFWKKRHKGYQLYYYFWQIGAYFCIRKLYKIIKFDLVHHITFGNNWMPSFLSLLPVDFVWGPLSSEDMPKVLLSELTIKEKLYELLRTVMLFWGHYLDPFVRLTIKHSKLILNSNSYWTKNPIPLKYQHKVLRFSQNALSTINQPLKDWNSVSQEFTVITVARLVHWKGVWLAGKAFVSLSKELKNTKMIMVGDGPEYGRLVRLFKKNNVLQKVLFTGTLSRNDFLETLRQGDVFLYPSFHHGPATVVLQAMTAGLPVVCLCCDAVGEMVTDDCGVRIKPRSTTQVVRDLSGVLKKLATNRVLCRKMGKKAMRRVKEEYSWETRQDQFKRFYELLGKRNSKAKVPVVQKMPRTKR